MSEWSEERVSALKSLYADGLSASQIAAELGGGLTRNAVIGKAGRLGLSRNKSLRIVPTRPPKEPRPARVVAGTRQQGLVPTEDDKTKAAKAAAGRLQFDAAMEKFEATEVTELSPEEVAATAVRLVDHSEGQCRWPLGDPTSETFRYCGAGITESHPYCARHCRMAYQPRAPRNDRRRAA